MFTSTNDVVEPMYYMDHPLLSPLNFFEFDGSILHWNNMTHDQLPFGANNEPIHAYSNMSLSKGNINEVVMEQEKGKIIGYNHGSNKKKGRVSKRGPSKGDRHSKIPTANGLRDRRMRLSLEVARQFFKLQDMLSYDKPSKTVKWLLLQAKPAIDELDKGKQSPCSGDAMKSVSSNCSEGEVVESATDRDEVMVKDVVPKAKTSKEKIKKKRNFDQFLPAAKQMRKEARERARERTLKKKQALGDFGWCIEEAENLKPYSTKPCSSNVVLEIEQPNYDELAQSWSSLQMSLSYDQENDSCKVNPTSEFQHVHPNMGQYWFY